MATTSNTYTGNGTNTLFSITFPYLETSDIDVYINGVLTTLYTFANETTIQMNTAPANGATILIDRSTDDTDLQATFFPGSSIKAADLNLDFDQVLYISQETANKADSATSTANTALTNANAAVSTANAAAVTANTAEANSLTAISTANTAESNSLAAVSTANAASASAATAISTANAATSTANSAISTANAATTTANQAAVDAAAAVSTANTASSDASAAVSTANTASSNASTAVSTANSAVSTANSAVSTANSAVSTANNALSVANNAEATALIASADATNAIAAIAAAALYVIIADVAAIPGSPSNGDGVQITDSTGIESFTPLNGLPVGFVGDPGLFVRLRYDGSALAWDWVEYQANDPDDRYIDKSGDTMAGTLSMGSNKITNVTDPTAAQEAATKNYVDTAVSGLSQNSISQSNSNVTVTDDGVADGEVRVSVDGATAIYFATTGTNAYTSTFHHNSISLVDQNELAFMEASGNGANTVGFKAPASIASDVTWTLPAADGTTGQALTTNGSGTLSWATTTDSTKLPLTGGTLTGNVTLDNQSDLRFGEATANGTNWVAFQAPAAITSNVTWTLPAADATVAGHALKSDAAGNLSWGTAGGATGGGTDDVFYENSQTVTTNYTLTAGKNAMTAGPVTINSGVTVTVPSGQSWSIV